MLPLLPLAITSTVGLGYMLIRSKRNPLKGVMTPLREKIYLEALNSLRAASELRNLASAFRGEGLTEEAELLDKRAAIKELPEEVRLKRRAVVKDALTWKDPDKVNQLAKSFDDVGANGAAALLRRYAAGLLPSDTIPVPAVARRRRRDTTSEENMAVNPFPSAPIPGALPGDQSSGDAPAAPDVSLPDAGLHNPDAGPSAPGGELPPIDPETGEMPSVNGEDPNVNVTIQESDDPSEPAEINVETNDPAHTEVEVTETDGD